MKMSERNKIINYFVEKLSTIDELSKVTTLVKPLDALSTTELPMVIIIDGDETREYSGARMLAYFDVHLRIIDDRSNHHKEPFFVNQLISKIEKLLEEDPYLGGLSVAPIEIDRIETDEGWLYPFTFANIVVKTTYTRVTPR